MEELSAPPEEKKLPTPEEKLPRPPIQPFSISVNKHRSMFPIILVVIILLVVLSGGIYYLGMQNSRTNQSSNITTPPAQFPISTIQQSQNLVLSNPTLIVKDEIKIGKVNIDINRIKQAQQLVDRGSQPWQLQPELVLLSEMTQYGFNGKDYGTVSNIPGAADQEKLGTEITSVNMEITHNNQIYTITLIQPVTGKGKIWTISEIELKRSNEPANWKTYINSQYGYEIKYPNSWSPWITQPDSFSLNEDWSEQISELAILQNLSCEFHLVSYSNPQNLSRGDFWKNLFGSYESSKSINNIMFGYNQVSGTEFIMERKDQPLPNKQTAVVVEHNNNFVVLLWWGQNPPDCASVDKILSTFKFTQ